MCDFLIPLQFLIQKPNLFKMILRPKQYSPYSPLTHCLQPEKSAKPEAFCCEHFCFSSFVLLTSPQLVQLKTLFHHMLSRSSSVAENAAKNLSAGFTVRMSCFTSNLSDTADGNKENTQQEKLSLDPLKLIIPEESRTS